MENIKELATLFFFINSLATLIFGIFITILLAIKDNQSPYLLFLIPGFNILMYVLFYIWYFCSKKQFCYNEII